MLTISAPIEIKAKTTYLRDPEAFYHRIVGGYSLMETRITTEDLLHITATPPEIYVAEGEGMTSILNRAERNETNITKVDILNNVMNRIIASADYQLTYQDRVFITDALYKLGIKDDRRFMEAFNQIALETKNTNALIDLYISQGENIKELMETVESMYIERLSNTTEKTERERENYLFNTILDRLKTGAVYQIVSNFNRTIDENSIDSREYSISSQSYQAQQIFLSMLRGEMGLKSQNLIFLTDNTYEESVENEDVQIKNVKNEITAAVLLDMLQNIYHTGYEKFLTSNETYYDFEDMFYKSSDQVFLRLMNSVMTKYYEDVSNESYIAESRNLINNELELINRGEKGQLTEEDIQRITENLNYVNVRDELRRQSTSSFQERRKEIFSLLSERDSFTNTETELINKVEEGRISEEEIRKITENLEQVNIRDEDRRQRILSIQDRRREIFSLLTEKNKLTSAELEILDNISNKQLTTEEINRIYETITNLNAQTKRLEKEYSTSTDRLRENITNVTETERNTESVTEHRQVTDTENITDEQIRSLTEAVNRINIENEKRRQQYVREITKLREQQPIEEPGANSIEQTRRDAQLALSNPQKLLQKLEEKREKKANRQNTIINELQHIFPDQSMEVYQILNNIQNGDVSLIQNNILRPAEIGELMSDVKKVSETVEQIQETPVKRDDEVAAFVEAVKVARQEEEAAKARGFERGPAQTIHRQNQTITAEELNEQLDMMEKNFSKHISKNVQNEVETVNRTDHVTEVRENVNQVNQISARDVQQMITSEMKSQMQAISNQVLGKIEHQMKNEKMRRGY